MADRDLARVPATALEQWHLVRNWITVTVFRLDRACDPDALTRNLAVVLAELPLAGGVAERGPGGELLWSLGPVAAEDCVRLVDPGGERRRTVDEVVELSRIWRRVSVLGDGVPFAVDIVRGPDGDDVAVACHHALFDGMSLFGIVARMFHSGEIADDPAVREAEWQKLRARSATSPHPGAVAPADALIDRARLTVPLARLEEVRHRLGGFRCTLGMLYATAMHRAVEGIMGVPEVTRIATTRSNLSNHDRNLMASGRFVKTGNDTSIWLTEMTAAELKQDGRELSAALRANMRAVEDPVELMSADGYVSNLGEFDFAPRVSEAVTDICGFTVMTAAGAAEGGPSGVNCLVVGENAYFSFKSFKPREQPAQAVRDRFAEALDSL